MFEKIKDFYSQDIRVDLAPASMLADLCPQNEAYCSAAARGSFMVSISQGDVHEGVYVPLLERPFSSISAAREFLEGLRSEYPTATYFDFVAHPTGTLPLKDGTA